MPDGRRAGHRHESLESRMLRKWPVLFGEGPTEKGWLTSTSPAAYSTLRRGKYREVPTYATPIALATTKRSFMPRNPAGDRGGRGCIVCID